MNGIPERRGSPAPTTRTLPLAGSGTVNSVESLPHQEDVKSAESAVWPVTHAAPWSMASALVVPSPRRQNPAFVEAGQPPKLDDEAHSPQRAAAEAMLPTNSTVDLPSVQQRIDQCCRELNTLFHQMSVHGANFIRMCADETPSETRAQELQQQRRCQSEIERLNNEVRELRDGRA